MLYKKGVLRNFAKFAGKHLRQSLFFDKAAGLRLTEKALISGRLRVSKVSLKLRIATTYNFAIPVKFTVFLKSSLLFAVSIVFFVYKQKVAARLTYKMQQL